MKEAYFTTESINKKAERMLNKYRRKTDISDLPLIPEQSALLVIDMQKYFLHKSSPAYIPTSAAIIPGIVKLIDQYHKNRLPIVFTRHLNTDENAKMMNSWWEDLIRQEDSLSEISDELNTSGGILIEKSQYDAFYQTPLLELLNSKSVKQVVICGVMTHLCCENTARSAFVRGLEVFFTIDGTATYSESHHEATLLNLCHGYALPVLVEEVVSSVQKKYAS